MEFTVNNISKMTGVSKRTLRYYDEIGILKPARINSSGYRIYGQSEIDRLHQIMFFRELDMSLEKIKSIMTSPHFNGVNSLKEHRKALVDKKAHLDRLIANIDKALISLGGGITMSNKEKFEVFKKNAIDENETKYGEEIRNRFGNDKVENANKKFKNMTEEEYVEVQKLASDIIDMLAKAFKTGDPAGELAQDVAEMHKKWLMFYWDSYSKNAHAGLAQMYVDDERFKAYYDKEQPGMAEFLRESILIYTGC